MDSEHTMNITENENNTAREEDVFALATSYTTYKIGKSETETKSGECILYYHNLSMLQKITSNYERGLLYPREIVCTKSVWVGFGMCFSF